MPEGPRGGRTLAILALGMVSLCAGLDHAWWAWSCTAPLVHGDSPRHALWALTWAQRELAAPSPLGLEVLGTPTYYPSLVAWLALPLMKALGPTGALFRTSLALYSGVLALGTGALAWRSFGRLAGITAAALTTVTPLLWMLRAEVTLDLPLAAMVAVFLASLPVDVERGRPTLAVGCGLALGVGLLTKQTMPYLALPALAVLGARALWLAVPRWRFPVVLGAGALLAAPGALYLRGAGPVAVGMLLCLLLAVLALSWRTGRWHLRDLAIVGTVGVAIAGTWYARSDEAILYGLHITRVHHADVPSGQAAAVRTLGMVEYLVFGLLPPPVLVLALLGVLTLPWWLRRRPLLWPTLAALVGGFVLISSFPDLHGRHYAPLVPLFIVVAVAPVGVLARSRWGITLAGALTTAALAWSLFMAASWHLDLAAPAALRVQSADADIAPGIPARDLVGVMRRLRRPPGTTRVVAPSPTASVLPLAEIWQIIDADRSGAARLVSADPAIEESGLQLLLDEVGAHRVKPLAHLDPHELREALGVMPVYALELVGPSGGAGPRRGRRHQLDPILTRLGFVELGRVDARLAGEPGPLSLVVLRGG